MVKSKGNHKSQAALEESHKSQAALEFLMTYGWVILVVLIAIGALAYFGVLSPDMFAPNRVSLPAGITALDHEVSTSRIILVLQNNFGKTITVNRIDVAGINGNSCSDTESIELKNIEKAIFTILNCNNGNIGEKFAGNINITYTKEGMLSHVMQGSIRAKIAEEAATTSAGVCQNADQDELCDGLDIVFGAGYKALCCSEHGLCCS